MKKLLLILSIALCLETNAQTWVTIPDAYFAAYLQNKIPAAMNGNQMDISNSLVTTTTHSINVDGYGIYDLDGVQYFTSLTYLNCGNNYFWYLPPLPNTLSWLSTKRCFNLNTLPLLPNSLVFLHCGENNLLTSLPTLPNNLSTLICYSCNLSSLPSLPNSLVYLVCDVNPLSSLPPLPNTLTYLSCGSNNYGPGGLPALPNSLIHLSCNGSGLLSLPTLPSSLTYLYCAINSLYSLPALPSSLDTLLCHQNHIACFPTFPNSISNLEIFNNPYDCLPNYISAMTQSDLAMPLCAAGNTNGCPVVNGTSGIAQVTFNNAQVLIYPDPSKGQFTIETNSIDKQTLHIYDVFGKELSNELLDLKEGKAQIDANKLPGGIYNLSLAAGNSIINRRIIISK